MPLETHSRPTVSIEFDPDCHQFANHSQPAERAPKHVAKRQLFMLLLVGQFMKAGVKRRIGRQVNSSPSIVIVVEYLALETSGTNEAESP